MVEYHIVEMTKEGDRTLEVRWDNGPCPRVGEAVYVNNATYHVASITHRLGDERESTVSKKMKSTRVIFLFVED